MNRGIRPLAFVLLLCTLIGSVFTVTASANSAEPPALVILVNNPPGDLSIVLQSNGIHPQGNVRRVAWEGYYVFYAREIQSDNGYTFRVTTGGESFACTIPEPLQGYHNVFTLDLDSRQLTAGLDPLRGVVLVSMRLLLTLLLEGVVFWRFGFRAKKSWLIFLAVNLVTQGALNIWLNNVSTLTSGYLVLALAFGELFVFTAELILLPILIEEHRKRRLVLYAFCANLISLIAGGYIITLLPV